MGEARSTFWTDIFQHSLVMKFGSLRPMSKSVLRTHVLKKIRETRLFQFLASVRFAIPALLVFAAALVYGTVCESLYGSDYVRREVYYTPWFYSIEVALVISLVFAVLNRIPLKKRLAGFYTVHASLVTLMFGALITHLYGVDGSIELEANGPPQSSVRLNEDLIYYFNSGTQESRSVPPSDHPATQFTSGARVEMARFLPFAKEQVSWDKGATGRSSQWFSQVRVRNPRMTQVLGLGSYEENGFQTRADLGPLHVEVLDLATLNAYAAALPRSGAQYLLVTPGRAFELSAAKTPQTLTLPGAKKASFAPVTIPKFNLTLLRLSIGAENFDFFPRYSPYPIRQHMAVDTASLYRLLELTTLRARPTAFISYNAQTKKLEILHGKGTQWKRVSYADAPLALPWMGLTLEFFEQHLGQTPTFSYIAAKPKKDDEQPVRAALLRVSPTAGAAAQEVWISNQRSTPLASTGIDAYLGSRELQLPFALRLERFKMVQERGLQSPASYESFVQVTHPGRSAESAHIYMNNPYKAEGFTLYQASYLQDDTGNYHTILSVNRDPGRPIKYLGSLLLVLGLILHFSMIYGIIKFK